LADAIAFLMKGIENSTSSRLLDIIFNSKAVALLLKTTRSDGEKAKLDDIDSEQAKQN